MKKILLTASLLFLFGGAALVCLNAPPPGMRETTFTVEYGDPAGRVARNLKKGGLIKSREFFLAASYAAGRRFIRAGRYRIFPRSTTLDILRKLTRGDVLSRKITIPEGFNLFQIADRLDANGICDAGTFLGYASDGEFLGTLRIGGDSAEGYLFPDTYTFPEASDARDIIAAMHRRMMGVVGDRPAYGPGMSLHEVLTIASLVEKEAKIYNEREIISSVFHNRLKRGMRLDCDPSVRYAVKKFAGPITVSDLKSDSPYNTYRRAGLPPTPICSPGRESLLAAMHPKKTGFLYFVAKNDGSHHFSKTLKEHNEAVRKYQR